MNLLNAKRIKPYEASTKYAALPESVLSKLSYVKQTQIRPFSYAFPPPSNEPWESGEHDYRLLPIHDARQAVIRTSIEKEGFELWDAPSAVVDFMDAEEVKKTYYKESMELALSVTGAYKAYVFDHLVRRREPKNEPLSFGKRTVNGLAPANGRIHNDYTEDSGRRRLNLVITDPDEASQVRRYSIVNIWRSIKGPVLDTPLAVCDARTLLINDFVTCDVRYPKRTGEIYLASYAESHRWSYFSQMDRHEALVFKQYDSQVSGTSRFTPHTAFDHPDAPIDTPPRESIELRCLVTY
jgi:hypothetical protein